MCDQQYPKHARSSNSRYKAGVVIIERIAGPGWHVAIFVRYNGLTTCRERNVDCFSRDSHVSVGYAVDGYMLGGDEDDGCC